MMLTTFTYTCTQSQSCAWAETICIVGMVDGRGYDGGQKYAICDTCRPCHSDLSILRPVLSLRSTDSLHLQLAQLPRSQDLAIFVSMTTTMTTEPIALSLAHTRGVIMVSLTSHPDNSDSSCWCQCC